MSVTIYQAVSAPTAIMFENRLDQFWSKQDIKFDFEATIDFIHAHKISAGTLTADQDLNIYRDPMTCIQKFIKYREVSDAVALW